MAANTNPIFTLTPNIGFAQWLPGTTANTDSSGIGTVGTSSLLLFTPGASGSFINKIRLQPGATTASTATTATVARFYLSTVSSGTTTAANTHLFGELACPSQTADQATVATNFLELPVGFYIPSTVFVIMSMHHAAAASTNWQAFCYAGDY